MDPARIPTKVPSRTAEILLGTFHLNIVQKESSLFLQIVLKKHIIDFVVIDSSTYDVMVSPYHMWHFRVEIEGYSVAYFDCITAFKVPYH